MTKTSNSKVVRRETPQVVLYGDSDRPIVVELHEKVLKLKLKQTKQEVKIEYEDLYKLLKDRDQD